MPVRKSRKKPYTSDGVHYFASKAALKSWQEYQANLQEQQQPSYTVGDNDAKRVLSSAGAIVVSRTALASRQAIIRATELQQIEPRLDTAKSRFHISRESDHALIPYSDNSVDFWPSTSFHEPTPRARKLETSSKYHKQHIGLGLKFKHDEPVVFHSFDLNDQKRFGKHDWVESSPEVSNLDDNRTEASVDIVEDVSNILCGVINKANGRGKVEYPQHGQVRRGEVTTSDHKTITVNYFRVTEQSAKETHHLATRDATRGSTESGTAKTSTHHVRATFSGQSSDPRSWQQDPRQVETRVSETRNAHRVKLPHTRLGIGMNREGDIDPVFDHLVNTSNKTTAVSKKRPREQHVHATVVTGSNHISSPAPKRIELVPEDNIFLPDDHAFSLIRRMLTSVALGAVKTSFRFWRDSLRALKAREYKEWALRTLNRFYLHRVRPFSYWKKRNLGVMKESVKVKQEIKKLFISKERIASEKRLTVYKTRKGCTQDGISYYWSEDHLVQAIIRRKQASQKAMNAMNRMVRGKVLLAFHNWFKFVTFEMGAMHAKLADADAKKLRDARVSRPWHPGVGIQFPKPLPVIGAKTGSEGKLIVEDISRYNSFKQQHSGPTDVSSWLFRNVHVKVLFGAYPRGQARIADKRVMARSGAVAALLLSGIDTFLSLLTESEEGLFQACHPHQLSYEDEIRVKHKEIREELLLGASACKEAMMFAKERADRGIKVGYGREQQLAMDRAYHNRKQDYTHAQRAVDDFPQTVDFIRFPTPFGGCAYDAKVLELLHNLEARMRNNCRLYVFSSDGNGRVGTIAALILGRLYGIRAHNAIERIQRHHDAQGRYAKGRDGVAAEPQSACPQYVVQKQQVNRLLKYTEAGYSALHRRGLVELGPGSDDLVMDESVRKADENWKQWKSTRSNQLTRMSSTLRPEALRTNARGSRRRAITLSEYRIGRDDGVPCLGDPVFDMVQEMEEDAAQGVDGKWVAVQEQSGTAEETDALVESRSQTNKDTIKLQAQGSSISSTSTSLSQDDSEKSNLQQAMFKRRSTKKILSGRCMSIRRISELPTDAPLHSTKSRRGSIEENKYDSQFLQSEVETPTPWKKLSEDVIVDHKVTYSFDSGYTVFYLIKSSMDESEQWKNRIDLLRTGTSNVLKMVEEYEAGPAREQLEQEGFETDIKFDVQTLRENSNLDQENFMFDELASIRSSGSSEDEDGDVEKVEYKQPEVVQTVVNNIEAMNINYPTHPENTNNNFISDVVEISAPVIQITSEEIESGIEMSKIDIESKEYEDFVFQEQQQTSEVACNKESAWENLTDCLILGHRSHYSITNGYSLMYLVQRGYRQPTWVQRETLLESSDETALRIVGQYELENETDLEEIGFDTEVDRSIFEPHLADLLEVEEVEEEETEVNVVAESDEDKHSEGSLSSFDYNQRFESVLPWTVEMEQAQYHGRIIAHRSRYSIEAGYSLVYLVDEGKLGSTKAEPQWIEREILLSSKHPGKLKMVEEYELVHENELEEIGFDTDVEYDKSILQDHPALPKLSPFVPHSFTSSDATFQFDDNQVGPIQTTDSFEELEMETVAPPSPSAYLGSGGRGTLSAITRTGFGERDSQSVLGHNRRESKSHTVASSSTSKEPGESARKSLVVEVKTSGALVPKLSVHRISFHTGT